MNINKRTIKRLYLVLLLLFCILTILFFYISGTKSKDQNSVNILRLDSNILYETILDFWPLDSDEINIVDKAAKADEISLSIVTLDDSIIFSNSQSLDLSGGKILRKAFYMDNNYVAKNENSFKISQPIYVDDQVEAFVIFEKVYGNIGEKTELYEKMLIAILSAVLFFILLLSGYALFRKNDRELKVIENGLMDISKGVLRPITSTHGNDYAKLYNTYNTLVEELTYIMKQQQSYEGQRKAFLTMISHELKTPIATISAYVEGLTSGIATDDETKEKYLSIITDKIRQLTKQVEDFFKYAQDEANRFKYNFEECYADEVIGEIFSSLVSNQSHDTSIKNQLPKCIFKVDKIRIEQVIMNLYNNALKHSSEEEPIILRAYREENDVVVEIEDCGEGISSKDLPYIFDYYYQGESSKKSDYEGIGLGLAICKNIVSSHNGSMKVKSKVGKGTTMFIKLPLV